MTCSWARYALTLTSLMATAFFCQAQRFDNVDFTVENNVIEIRYDLVDCPSKTLYDIAVSFVGRDNRTILPRTIEGDLKKISGGSKRQITWQYTSDVTDVLQAELKVVLTITRTYSTQIKGGAGNVVFSMMLPGWGDHYVNRVDKTLPYMVNLLFLGAVGYGVYNKMESDKFYDNYHKATTQVVMNEEYNKANEANKLFMYCAAGAAAIWLTDVIRVIAKGSANARQQKRRNGLVMRDGSWQPILANNTGGLRFGFIKKF
jgi:hypothetical protein